jgi:hypothetical protein
LLAPHALQQSNHGHNHTLNRDRSRTYHSASAFVVRAV